MTETTKTLHLLAESIVYKGVPVRKTTVFTDAKLVNTFLEKNPYYRLIGTGTAQGIIAGWNGEYGITTYGDVDADDLDGICSKDGYTWEPLRKEPQKVLGVDYMVWALVPDDPRTSDRVAYEERVATW